MNSTNMTANNKRNIRVRIIAIALSAVAAASAIGVFAGCNSGSSGSTAKVTPKENVSTLDKSKSKNKSAAMFEFSNAAFSKAKKAAEMFNNDNSAGSVEKIMKELGLTSLTITDKKGVVIASNQAEDIGKNIKKLPDRAIFNKVVKGLSEKLMNDPEYQADGNTYSILAGVRKDEKSGVVVVGFNDPSYAAIAGTTAP